MRFLHTMVRIRNKEESLAFYCDVLGLIEVRRRESQKGRFTLIFLAAPSQLDQASQSNAPLLELTYNWDSESYDNGRNFGHLAFEVDHIYKICQRLILLR